MDLPIIGQRPPPRPVPHIIQSSTETEAQPRAGLLAYGARDGLRDLGHAMVQGRGPRVQMQMQRTVGGTFADEDDKNAGADEALMKRISHLLHLHYRGHFWAVHACHRSGVAMITIPLLLGHYKYVIKLRDYDGEFLDRKVIAAGGEILERFKIPRGSLDVAAFIDAKQFAVPRRADARAPA